MKFIDEATIVVQSGDGGPGCVSFRRERFVPKGGPDGGSGGKGGSVILRAAPNKRTLYHLHFKKEYKAANGVPGQGRQKSGRAGADLVLDLPVGTMVRDAETGELLHDLVTAEQTSVVAAGGRGGQGNTHFKSSTHRTPRFAQPGEPGQRLTLRLELKLIADVGLIGLPNAGKSTLISAISSARPKIADYPFTTLTPNLGVVALAGAEPYVVADIPGLIEGAHTGAGLGTRFLRHVERTRFLVHLIDAGALDAGNPLQAYTTVNRELAGYSAALAAKPQLVVLNKLDITEAEASADAFCRALSGVEVVRISAATGQGVQRLTHLLRQRLDLLDEADDQP
ncbi:GTPase ObgE [Desulfatitalea alkaliphila]|uniref:GTPase Obg n=1 Tax=Desulfatitalea alkaliphila TaxID=2929485 RepID=A0AA41R8R0_9BACT|nr:GTPase ObgE [Desulfatitalea alkaliphila]